MSKLSQCLKLVSLTNEWRKVIDLRVEYAERGKLYGILFTFSLFREYIDLEYIRIHVVYS